MTTRGAIWAFAALTALVAIACDREAETPRAPAGDTVTGALPPPAPGNVRDTLPSGRFQLPTRHTPVPDLWVTLPAGFKITSVGKLPNDQFYVYRSDDPALTDRMAVTPGVMEIYVGVNPRTVRDPKETVTEVKDTIGTYPATWKTWRELTPKGMYYQSEIISNDFFDSLSPEIAKAPLNLRLYVGGSDSFNVRRLMEAARSISITP